MTNRATNTNRNLIISLVPNLKEEVKIIQDQILKLEQVVILELILSQDSNLIQDLNCY